MPVFAFEGTDSAGTVRRGAMQATNKYEAFKRLRDDQKLFLTMLSPVGVLPKFNDPELDQWQRGAKMGVAQSVPVKILPSAISSAPPTATPAPRPTIGFTNVAKEEDKPVTAPKVTQVSGYHPLAATLRLYAGWLLAWYGFFVAIGYYSVNRALPWDIPFVQAFYLSPLIFSFMVAIFIFLMLSTVHRTMKGGLLSGLAFTVLGVTLFFGVKMLA